jgi:hypothetical protein
MDSYNQIIAARSLRKNARMELYADYYNNFDSNCAKAITKERIIEFFTNNLTDNLSIYIPFFNFSNVIYKIDHKIFNDIVNKHVRLLSGNSCRLIAGPYEWHSIFEEDPIIDEFNLKKEGSDTRYKLKFDIKFNPDAQNHGVIGMTIIENRKKLIEIKNEKINQILHSTIEHCVQEIINKTPIEFFSTHVTNNLDVYIDIPLVTNDIRKEFMDAIETNVIAKIYETLNCKEFISIKFVRYWPRKAVPDATTTKIKFTLTFIDEDGASIQTPAN